ncbi:MAG: LytTR family DNA-binding domain-containing protein [Acidobacteria bacterium]|nr:LytTR family DNA-binding domain-containing protein [Acidobacteriota bacterium]
MNASSGGLDSGSGPLRAVAVDDSQKALEVIRLHAERVPFVDLEKTFRSPFDALDYVKREAVDLVFLDIEMPDLSGMRLAGLLPHGVMVIFTTAYSEYALESYELDAVDYLHKPIELDRFVEAVDKAQTRSGLLDSARAARAAAVGEQLVDFKSGKTVHRVRVGEILYVEGKGNYVKVCCRGRSFMVYASMRKTERQLSRRGFVRIHRSYIVSLGNLESAGRQAVVVGGRRLRVGEKYAESFARTMGLD